MSKPSAMCISSVLGVFIVATFAFVGIRGLRTAEVQLVAEPLLPGEVDTFSVPLPDGWNTLTDKTVVREVTIYRDVVLPEGCDMLELDYESVDTYLGRPMKLVKPSAVRCIRQVQ